MKIEKVNDHQIRCTLTKADLADRELKISELAYGTEKAKSLFRDMMQQASLKFGFEAEDIPLMIEAIPLNADCIVLIITKVEDPEELDTRFSKFAPSVHDNDDAYPDDAIEDAVNNLSSAGDDVLDLFKRIKKNSASKNEVPKDNTLSSSSISPAKESEESPQISKNMIKVFSFSSLYEITKPATVLKDIYDGKNSLYKNTSTGRYLLVINKSTQTPESFNKVCNILSEYGMLEKAVPASEYYFEEHFDSISKGNALQSLALVTSNS